jgi:HSP20 family protein
MAREEKKGKPAQRELLPIRSLSEIAPFKRMERFFDEFMGRPLGSWWPEIRWPVEILKAPFVDVYEEGDDIVLKAELPGMKKEDIDLEISGDVVTLSGEKKQEEKVERKNYHRFERLYGSFSRSLTLPAEIQVQKATAKFKDGVLELRAPKTEEAKQKSRKLEIQ